MLFMYNSQQWLNVDYIGAIDDYGFDFEVTLMNGRKCRIDGHRRDDFFALVQKANGACTATVK